jgi:hypothetical protein
MKRFMIYELFLMLVLSGFLLGTCEKQEYDLFPLKVGNEFYYTYHKDRYSGLHTYTNGTERWKVISVSSQGNSDIYRIERRLNAILEIDSRQPIIISDSLSFFEISEDKSSSILSSSSMLLYLEISFKRYQIDPVFEIKHVNIGFEDWSYLFKADSGLTKFTYYHPPNQITNESLHLDSCKIYL